MRKINPCGAAIIVSGFQQSFGAGRHAGGTSARHIVSDLVSMISEQDSEAAPDAALRLRAFAELRPKRRFKENQPTSRDGIVELKLPDPMASAPLLRQRIRRSGRAQMRWRVSPETCQPASKLSLAPVLHEFMGLFTHAVAAWVPARDKQELNSTRAKKIFQSLFSAD